MSTLHFTRIEIENWRNFSSAKVDLARRVFLVGPNAIGKSNFLDVFRFLRDIVTEGGGLGKAVETRGGMGRVRSLYARQNTDVSVRAWVLDESGDGWRYELSFSHESPKRPRPMVTREIVWRIPAQRPEIQVLERPDPNDQHDRERLSQTALQQTVANQDFRTLADFFRQVSYLHIVPQLLREEQRARKETLGPDPFGRDLLERIRHTSPRMQRARLKRIEKVLSVVAPQLKELKLEIDDNGLPHLESKFLHWRPQGAYQNETQFSDGTLRLIGLLWALQEESAPLLLEEPELSLHAAIVKRLAGFIYRAQALGSGRQVILSTHSEHLLSDPGIAPGEVLMIQPTKEGSEVIAGAVHKQICRLMESGLSAAEAILPRTEGTQMGLFDRLAV